MNRSEKLILLDADVISHFIACSEILFLPKILDPHEIVILETVYNEIARILVIALNKGIFDEARCNHFIATAKAKNNARFPVGVVKITDYRAPDLTFI